MNEVRPAGLPPGFMFAAATIIVLSHITVSGWTFDEAETIVRAQSLIAWIGGDASTTEVWFGEERPSPPKALAALGISIFGVTKFGVRLFPALLYAFAATSVYAAVRKPRGPIAGYGAFFALLLTPPLFSFSTQVSNEAVASALILILLSRTPAARTGKEWLLIGFLGGLALGTKVSALVAVFAVAWKKFRWVALGVLGGFLLTWPPLIVDPLAALKHVAHFAEIERPPVLFFGIAAAPPWYYAPFWLAAGLPSLVVILGAAELIFARGPLRNLLALYFGVGFLVAIVAHPYLREGLRHLLPLAVILPVCAGLAIGRIAIRFPKARYVLLAAFVILLMHRFDESVYLAVDPIGYRLPITYSGDVLTDNVLARLPAGDYAAVPGALCDRPLRFAPLAWRELLSTKEIKFTTVESAEHLVIFGSGAPGGLVHILPVKKLRNSI